MTFLLLLQVEVTIFYFLNSTRMLHEISNLNVEIMRDRRLASSFVYLTIKDSSFVRLYGSIEKKKYRNWIYWPEVHKALLSLNTALTGSFTKSLGVINDVWSEGI